ncbi:MAG: hypothetical protein Phog2KO_30020 [Phototrophicaceae bacterium]
MTRQAIIRISTILTLLLIWAVWTFAIGDVLYNSRETTHGWVASAVRNYDRYTYDEIGFSIVWDNEVTEDISSLTVYSHHPPLVAWMPAILTRLIGDNVLALKIGFSLVMFIAVSAFYALTKQMYGEKIAFWALLLFGLMPMTSFYQIMLRHDSLGFAAALLYALIFYNWLKKPTLLLYCGLIVTTILAVWTAWPAVFFVATIGIYGMLVGNISQRFGVFILGIITILSFVIMMLLYEMWSSGAVSSTLTAFLWRTSSASLRVGSEPFTLIDWVFSTLYHIGYYGTIPVLIFSVLGLRSFWQKNNRLQIGFTLALFLSGWLYLLVFRNAGYLHTYYKAFVMPGMTILAAFGIVHFRQYKPRFTRPFVDGLVIAFFLQVALVLFISYQTPHKDDIGEVIDYMNQTPDLTQPIYILFPEASYATDLGIEYYTSTNIGWNLMLEEIPETDEPFTFIFCFEEQDYVERVYGSEQDAEAINDYCSVYLLDGTPNLDDE